MPQINLTFDGNKDEQVTPAIKGYIQEVRVEYAQDCHVLIEDAPKGVGRTLLLVQGVSKELFLYRPREFSQDIYGEAVASYERFYVDGRPLKVVMKSGDKNKKPRGTVIIVWSDIHA